ncbi:hypothetical protein PS385_00440 [Limosilactobacillus fermentum]|uniref:hypothetical protein n=1 Tax=Limosilactobacillus fermentum TaxID=1613 RepID=UPI002F265A40
MNFFINHWEAIIASLSFLMSVYTLWKNRTKIDVQWNHNIEEAGIDSVYCLKKNKNVGSYNFSYITHVDVINPSPRDIGYFDLRAFNPETNHNLHLLTKQSLTLGYEGSTIVHSVGKERYRMIIPERNSGVFKANSITKLDLVVVLNNSKDSYKELESLNTIAVSFRIAKFVISNRDPFARGMFRHYWYQGMKYDINGWQTRRTKQAAMQQSASAHQKKTSLKGLLSNFLQS